MNAPIPEFQGPVNGPDDILLLQRCADGDEKAWREFVLRYTNLIYYVIRVRCGYHNEDAEEIYQSTFLKILSHLDQLKDNTRLKSWLLAITFHECINFSRQRKASRKFLTGSEGLEEGSHQGPENALTLRDMLGHFRRAFTRLSPTNKALLAEKYRGASTQEIAGKLHMPRGSVNYQHKKACRELQGILEELHYNYDEFRALLEGVLLPLE